MIVGYSSLLNTPAQTAAGTAYNTSTTLTDVSPLPHVNLLANFLVPGSILRLSSWGVFSNTATPTLLLGFYYGAVAGVALGASLATTTASGVTNVPWRLEADVFVRTVGTSGTARVNGKMFLGTTVSAWAVSPIPQVASADVSIDTTVAKSITTGAQWGTNSASNTLTCHGILVESLA